MRRHSVRIKSISKFYQIFSKLVVDADAAYSPVKMSKQKYDRSSESKLNTDTYKYTIKFAQYKRYKVGTATR